MGWLTEDDLDLFDFDQYAFSGRTEWDGSNHVMVESEPSREAAARGEL